MKKLRNMLLALAMAVSVFVLAPPAQAHGNCAGGGQVNVNLNGNVTGSGTFSCDYTHSALRGDFYIQEKYASQTSYHNINSKSSSCVSCRSTGVIFGNNFETCVHNAVYRVKIVGYATSHATYTAYRDTSTLC